jgi:vitamin B12 transporter
VPRTRVRGWTASAEGRWAGWRWTASLDHLDPRNVTEGSPQQGLLLPRRAEDSLRLAADGRVGPLDLGATLAAFGRRFDDAANTVRLAGYRTLDLRAEWAAAPLPPGWAIGLVVNNAADERYETVRGYEQPGREWLLTLRVGAR